MTDYEMNRRLTAPIKAVLEAMSKGLDGMNEDGSDFYDQNFYFGFGNPVGGIRTAEMYVCPESYEAMETALAELLDFISAEYPVERIERQDDEVYYIAQDGTRYDIGEIKTPNGEKTFDMTVLVRHENNEEEDGDIIDYVMGGSTMTDDELMKWCRETVEHHTKK